MSTSNGDDFVRASYHHGNLRQALIEAGTGILREAGVTGLSLRGVARRAGVSQTAPYRHFRDKSALLAAIAAEGFRGLTRAMRKTSEGLDDPRERMAAIGRGYVTFAVANSALVRLMFGPEIADKSADAELCAAADEAFAVLAGEVAGRGTPGDAVPDAALAAWSLVHGLATLVIDGQIRPGMFGEGDIDPGEMVDRLGRFLRFG